MGVVAPLDNGVLLCPSDSVLIDTVRSKGGGDFARGDSKPEAEFVGETTIRGVLKKSNMVRQ